jgi:hypothetical protein
MSFDWVRVLPAGWQCVEKRMDGRKYVCPHRGLAVIMSIAQELDGKRWLHFSLSHRSRIPKWDELVEMRNLFIGDVYCYQVLPPRSKYVNICKTCLHLFHCLDGNPLPDFTHGSDSL